LDNNKGFGKILMVLKKFEKSGLSIYGLKFLLKEHSKYY